jgi:putative tryptophan/tyrosine transport system substrate-binding protein
VNRRTFITLIGGAAAAWPLTARAQQPAKIWRIGFAAGGARPVQLESSPYAGFLRGMHELGYAEGRDFVIEWRFAEGRYELFPDFAAEFARVKVDLIVTALALAVPSMKQANPNIPIVMGYSTDPVGQGLVASLARPGGNTTGLASALDEIMAKQVDLLVTAVPNLTRVAVLTNPANFTAPIIFKSVESTAQQARISLLPAQAQSAQEIESVFNTVTRERVDAVIVMVDALFFAHRQRIVELTLGARLPSMFGNREYAEAGGLMSYGDSLHEFYRRAATFVDKIFKGAKPSDLPIEHPTKFNLVINRKTADTLGLTISPRLYIFADEVIE